MGEKNRENNWGKAGRKAIIYSQAQDREGSWASRKGESCLKDQQPLAFTVILSRGKYREEKGSTGQRALGDAHVLHQGAKEGFIQDWCYGVLHCSCLSPSCNEMQLGEVILQSYHTEIFWKIFWKKLWDFVGICQILWNKTLLSLSDSGFSIICVIHLFSLGHLNFFLWGSISLTIT